jgi:hypothetical protein
MGVSWFFSQMTSVAWRTHARTKRSVTSTQTYYYVMYCNIVVMTSYTSLGGVRYYFLPRVTHVVCNMHVCAQTFDDKFPQLETIAYFKFKRILRYYNIMLLLCTPRDGRLRFLFWLKTYFCICVYVWCVRGRERKKVEKDKMIHMVRYFSENFYIYIYLLYIIYYIIWTKIKFVYVFFLSSNNIHALVNYGRVYSAITKKHQYVDGGRHLFSFIIKINICSYLFRKK